MVFFLILIKIILFYNDIYFQGNGSDVAKEASEFVFIDNNFASVVDGIEEGRMLFDNLKKVIAYLVAHLLPEILPILLNLAAGLPLAFGTL